MCIAVRDYYCIHDVHVYVVLYSLSSSIMWMFYRPVMYSLFLSHYKLRTCMQIGQHFREGYLHKDEFKIVYVAPMKVLGSLAVFSVFLFSFSFCSLKLLCFVGNILVIYRLWLQK